MDGRSGTGEIVVDLKDVPAPVAFIWGIEAGTFMRDVANGEGCGVQVFHAGNMGMIHMIAAEKNLDVTITGSENELVRCWITPRKLHVIKGGRQ